MDNAPSAPSSLNSSTISPKDKKISRVRKTLKQQDATILPSSVVCTARTGKSIELGLILSLLIFCLYLYGCFETMMSLPEIPMSRSWSHHIGENFNLAKDEWMLRKNVLAHLEEELVKDVEELDGTDNPDVQEQQKLPATHRLAQKPVTAAGGALKIPEGKWPVSVKHDVELFETILHPGDKKTTMSVPKFWSAPVHNMQLMTRETAMKIGTCRTPDPGTGSHVRGEDCPLKDRTIFIGIASYRDFQCRHTLESAYRAARYPERIRVGVVDQVISGTDVLCNDPIRPCEDYPDQALCKFKDQVDVYEMDAELSVGPVFARHIGYRMYRGEYYATQSDAHVTFVKHWDVDIIEQMEATKNEMAVLSTYLTDVQGSIDPKTGLSLRHTRPIMCNTYYEGDAQGMHLRHGSQPERRPAIHGMPQLQPWWAAGYSFSRGHFIVNVPYDLYQPMIFQGEEMSIGIRGFTVGYDFYAPERSACFHHYAIGKNAKIRNKVHHFWDNASLYAGTGKAAMARLLGIVHMNPETDPESWDHTDEDVYGLGGARTPEKFYEIYGIDVFNKQTEAHLCDFVESGQIHREFTPFLRLDGMGLDYSQINYRFKDPNPGGKTFK